MTRSEAGARQLESLGATVAQASAYDAPAVEQALRQSRAEVVIDELTALPRTPAEMAAAAPGDRKLRLEAGGILHRTAIACGVRRYMQQTSAFFHGQGLADESVGLAIDASPGVAASARTYVELESRVLNATAIEGVSLRYGFFYGPGTWYNPDGAAADQAHRGELAVIGAGEGVWSWVHINDAAIATVAALTAPAGAYNMVDDDPATVSRWLPVFARWVDAPPPAADNRTGSTRVRRRRCCLLRHRASRRLEHQSQADTRFQTSPSAVVAVLRLRRKHRQRPAQHAISSQSERRQTRYDQ
jgi:nucleoside-diphosphate-sugar epimerase